MRPALTFTATLALAATTGCAFTNVEVHRSPPIAMMPSAVGRDREVLVDIPFPEGRHLLGRCGMKKNGYNMDTADVTCSEAPGSWVGHSIAAGLVAAGFRVLAPGSKPGPNTVVVRGTVQQFFIEPKAGFLSSTLEADISVKLVVTSQSGLIAERTFYVKGEHAMSLGTEDEFQEAADAATYTMVRVTVVSIGALLDQYPTLGTRPAAAVASAP